MHLPTRSISKKNLYLNEYRIYVDIMSGKNNFRQFRLLTRTSNISQFVHPVGGNVVG